MPRPISKIRQAEATIAEQQGEIARLNLIVAAMKITELETEVALHQERLNFTTHKINNARVNFSKLVQESKDA